jgi:hypothetical protein
LRIVSVPVFGNIVTAPLLRFLCTGIGWRLSDGTVHHALLACSLSQARPVRVSTNVAQQRRTKYFAISSRFSNTAKLSSQQLHYSSTAASMLMMMVAAATPAVALLAQYAIHSSVPLCWTFYIQLAVR